MALTRQQIAQNVQKLKKAGVPDAKIKQYLQSATKELPTKKRKKSVLETTSDIGEKFFLSPLSKFFGIKQATEFVGEQGKRIGTSLAQFDPIVREQISKSPEAFENITGQDISAKKEVGKVAGEALTTAASIAPFATGFAGASVASKLSKPAQIGLKGAGIGATRGAGEALQEGEDFKSVATKAITSGAISDTSL